MPLRMSYASEAVETAYTLNLSNDSAAPYTFYVFQKLPDQSPNVFSLAWFASPFTITPGSQIEFDWSIAYNFVWGSTGKLQPGVTFRAGGAVSASPDAANTTTFSTDPGPNLSKPTSGQPKGSLVISDDVTVPSNQFSVGIGMSGAGTFAVQAGPNLTHTFTPTPTYWIGAGSNVSVGSVLEITTNNPIEQVSFPPSVYKLNYSLNESNTWEQK